MIYKGTYPLQNGIYLFYTITEYLNSKNQGQHRLLVIAAFISISFHEKVFIIRQTFHGLSFKGEREVGKIAWGLRYFGRVFRGVVAY